MRTLLLALSILVGSMGCSSSDSDQTTTDSGPNACVSSGGQCAFNIPFTCNLASEPATDSLRVNACGKSDEAVPRDIPCCIPLTMPLDTGTTEDTRADVGTDTSPDSSSEGDSSTADATEGG